MSAPVTNLDDAAVEAAADRFLSGKHAERVRVAQDALSKAKARLADAELAAGEAAADFARHEWDGSRRRVLETREAVELANALVGAAEANLAEAKKRWPTAMRERALEMVRARREWNGLAAKRTAQRKRVVKAARALLDALREGSEIEMEGTHIGARVVHGAESFDGQRIGALQPFTPPRAMNLNAAAVLEACQAMGYSPWDFRDLGAAVADALKADNAARIPPPYPRPGRSDEDRQRQRDTNTRTRQEAERQVRANDARNNTQRLAGEIVTGLTG